MKAIEFPQQHGIVAKDQPEYIPLPAHYKIEPVKFKDADGNEIVKDTIMELTVCFQLEPEEIAQVIATKKIWYTQCVWGQNMQPIRMSVLSPFEPTPAEYGSYSTDDDPAFGLPEHVVSTIKRAVIEMNETNYASVCESLLLYIGLLKSKPLPTQAAPDQSRVVTLIQNNSEAFRNWAENIEGYEIIGMGHGTGVYLEQSETRFSLLKKWDAYERANNPKYKNP